MSGPVSMLRWHPVENYPDNWKTVLVATSEDSTSAEGYRIGDQWYRTYTGGVLVPTAWAKLPNVEDALTVEDVLDAARYFDSMADDAEAFAYAHPEDRLETILSLGDAKKYSLLAYRTSQKKANEL